MNLDTLEKLARAATTDPVYASDLSRLEDFQDAANPAAIIQLIERLKAAEHHLGNILSDPFAEDCQECAVGTSTSWANAKAALARSKGESNE